jgi:hypothetical protein
MSPVPAQDIANGVDNDARSTIFSKKGTDVKAMAVGTQNKNGKAILPTIPEFKSKDEEQKYCKEHLACAFRVFADQGFDEGVAGHMSLRDPIHPDRFWINPYISPSLIKKRLMTDAGIGKTGTPSTSPT